MIDRRIFFFVCILLITLPFSYAFGEIKFVESIYNDVNIVDNCYNDGANCASTALCNVTVGNDNSVIVNDAPMTNQGSFINYTLSSNSINLSGQYYYSIVCIDGAVYGNTREVFILNTDGVDVVNSNFMLYLIVFVAVLIALFITLIFIIEGGLKFVFLNLTALLVPVLIFFLAKYSEYSLMSVSIVNSLWTAYTIGLYLFFGLLLYTLITLIMKLKVPKKRPIPEFESPLQKTKRERIEKRESKKRYTFGSHN